jgi:hypothetical protein
MTATPIHQWLEIVGQADSALSMLGTPWLLAGIPFAVVIFLWFWRFLLHLPFATRALFLLAGALYIAGAIGLEALGGRYLLQHEGNHTLTYEMMVGVEEGLEMLGVIVFLYALMMYMAKHRISLEVVLNSSSEPVEHVSQPERLERENEFEKPRSQNATDR